MELVQDVWGIIFTMMPFAAKNLALVNKYFYNTYLLTKKAYATGNYILTTIQKRLIEDMTAHIASQTDLSLIIQSNLSTGKTAGILAFARSEEHTSELQSRFDLVCRLLLE